MPVKLVVLVALCLSIFASPARAVQGMPEEIEQLEREVQNLVAADADPFDIYLARDALSAATHEQGVALNQSVRPREALPYFERAFAIDRENSGLESPESLTSANSLATAFNFAGRYNDSAEILREVLAATENMPDLRSSRWSLLNTLAGSMTGQGRLEEAEWILRDIVEQMEADELDISSSPFLLLITNNLAHNLHEQQRYAEANEIFAQVVAHYRDAGDDGTEPGLLARHNLAANLAASGDAEAALPVAQAVYDERSRLLGPQHFDTLTSLSVLGFATTEIGGDDAGIDMLRSAAEGRLARLGEDHPDVARSELALVEAYLNAGGYEEEAFALADRNSQRADRRLAALGFSAMEAEQYRRERELSQNAYTLLLEADWALSANETGPATRKAFTTLQRLQMDQATEAVALSAANRVAAAEGLGALTQERAELSDEWADQEQLLIQLAALEDESAIERRRALRERQAQIVARLSALDSEIAATAPPYFALIRPQPLSPAQGQALLNGNEAALLVSPTNRGTHIILLRDDRAYWHRSSMTAEEIGAAVRRLRWEVGADSGATEAEARRWRAGREGVYPYDFETAHRLYSELIAPFTDQLGGADLLFISASGALSNIPFSLLVREVPAGRSGDPAVLRSAQWLSDAFALIQIPSLQSLQYLRDFRSTELSGDRPQFLGFGDPVLEGEAATRGAGRGQRNGSVSTSFEGAEGLRTGGLRSPSDIRRMARLPGTATELQAIWTQFGAPPAALYLAESATEQSVREMALNAELIVFATHGLLASEVQWAGEPGLIFTPRNEDNPDNDGFLASSDIAGMTVQADWVVLSACNTASSDGDAGSSGLSGLARSFFYAGARTLLASHWPVRDDVAARITVRTIELERSNPELSRARAFSMAMAEIRNDRGHDTEQDTWAHPNAWAPFVLVGDGLGRNSQR